MSWFSCGDESAEASLSYKQRLSMFAGLALLAVVFFGLASMSVLMPTKFAKLFFLGSFFLISALAFLVGPAALLASAFQAERLPSTLGYLGSAAATLVCATVLESVVLTLVALVAQSGCAVWLALSFLPFGQQMFGVARSLLPI
jgi:hypothetical protein